MKTSQERVARELAQDENFHERKAQDLADQLEQLVDKWTLTVVLDALAEVCTMKAHHLECNWQDRRSAKVWADAAKRIDRNRQFSSDSQI